MKNISDKGFCCLSSELFSSFFTSDRLLTEEIINTILETEFIIDGVEEASVPKEEFGYYHPFVFADARTAEGHCTLILTVIDESVMDDTSRLLSWMLYSQSLRARNVYPVIVSFDSTLFPEDGRNVSMRIVESQSVSFALAVVNLHFCAVGKDRRKDLIVDLMCPLGEAIRDERIRKAYDEAYVRSGMDEKKRVSYSLWLKSLMRDIDSLSPPPAGTPEKGEK